MRERHADAAAAFIISARSADRAGRERSYAKDAAR